MVLVTVEVNVSGTRFTLSNVIWQCIKNRMADKSRLHESKDEIFIEGHADAFQAIMYYHMAGELHLPASMCPSSFKQELQMYGTDPSTLAKCCFSKYVTYFDDDEVLKVLEADESDRITLNARLDELSRHSGWQGVRAKMNLVMNEPFYSRTSKAYFLVNSVLIIVSLATLIAGTHPMFQRELNIDEWKAYFGDEWPNVKYMFASSEVDSPNSGKVNPEPDIWEDTTESETTPETNPESKPEAEALGEPEAESIKEPYTKHEPERMAYPEPGKDAENSPTSEPESTSEPEPNTENSPTSEPENTSEPEPNTGNSSTSEPESTLEPEPNTDTGNSSTSEPENTSEPEPNTDAKNSPSSEPESTSEPEPNTDAQNRPSGEPESTSEPEPNTNAGNSPSSEPERTSEPEPNTNAENSPASEQEITPETEHDIYPKNSPISEPESRSESETTPEPETESGTCCECINTVPESNTEPGTDPEQDGVGEQEPIALPENAFVRYSYLEYSEYVSMVCFTIDLLVRYIFCMDIKRLLMSFLHWVDVFSLLVVYIRYTVEEIRPEEKYEASFVDMLHCLQVVRVFRLFRLVKNFVGFRVLLYAIRASFKELLLMSMFMVVGMLLFSTMAFFSGDPAFPNIPKSCWWSIVTMTTVGYGDIIPSTALSQIIGILCAISGICLLAVIIPIFVNYFVMFYNYTKVWGKKNDPAQSISTGDLTDLPIEQNGKTRKIELP